jgi:hypothetical protein
MSQGNESDSTSNVNGVQGNSRPVSDDRVEIETNQHEPTTKNSNNLPPKLDGSPFGLDEQKKQVEKDERIILRKKEEASVDVEANIRLRIYKRAAGSKIDLDEQRIDEIGEVLLKNYGIIDDSAEELGLKRTQLLYHIANNPELQMYHRIAIEGIKSLTDKNMVDFLKGEDKEDKKFATRLTFNKMYSGRDKGGYNISEFGTTGYEDENAQALVEQTKEAMDAKNKFTINVNFVDTKVRYISPEAELLDEANYAAQEVTSEDAIEGEYEMVDKQFSEGD